MVIVALKVDKKMRRLAIQPALFKFTFIAALEACVSSDTVLWNTQRRHKRLGRTAFSMFLFSPFVDARFICKLNFFSPMSDS